MLGVPPHLYLLGSLAEWREEEKREGEGKIIYKAQDDLTKCDTF